MNAQVLATLTDHLSKFQFYLKHLKEPTDTKIKEPIYFACAQAALNEDFEPILSHVAISFIQVMEKCSWDATIPLVKFLDYVFNAHKQLDFQSHELEHVNNRRLKLLEYLVEAKLETTLTNCFKKLRSTIEKSDNLTEDRLIDFYNFRRKWRKKPGGHLLKGCLARMDNLIYNFDSEWPKYDQDLIKEGSQTFNKHGTNGTVHEKLTNQIQESKEEMSIPSGTSAKNFVNVQKSRRHSGRHRSGSEKSGISVKSGKSDKKLEVKKNDAESTKFENLSNEQDNLKASSNNSPNILTPVNIPILSTKEKVSSVKEEEINLNSDNIDLLLKPSRASSSRMSTSSSKRSKHRKYSEVSSKSSNKSYKNKVDKSVFDQLRADSVSSHDLIISDCEETIKAVCKSDNRPEEKGLDESFDSEIEEENDLLSQRLKGIDPNPILNKQKQPSTHSEDEDSIHTDATPTEIVKKDNLSDSDSLNINQNFNYTDENDENTKILDKKQKYSSIGLDTDDLRLLSCRDKSFQMDHLSTGTFKNADSQTENDTKSVGISANINSDKKMINQNSQTEVTFFSETKSDQHRYMMKIATQFFKTMEDYMVNRKLTDYTIRFSFADTDNNSMESNPCSSSRVKDVLPDLAVYFPGAKITEDQEVSFELHKPVVETVCPKLITLSNEGANLSWSDYITLVAGCAVVSYLYTRIVTFDHLNKLSVDIYNYRQSYYWEGSDLRYESTHDIFLHILEKIESVCDMFDVVWLKKGLLEVNDLIKSLGQSKKDNDKRRMYKYKVIGSRLSGPPISRQLANISLSGNQIILLDTPKSNKKLTKISKSSSREKSRSNSSTKHHHSSAKKTKPERTPKRHKSKSSSKDRKKESTFKAQESAALASVLVPNKQKSDYFPEKIGGDKIKDKKHKHVVEKIVDVFNDSDSGKSNQKNKDEKILVEKKTDKHKSKDRKRKKSSSDNKILKKKRKESPNKKKDKSKIESSDKKNGDKNTPKRTKDKSNKKDESKLPKSARTESKNAKIDQKSKEKVKNDKSKNEYDSDTGLQDISCDDLNKSNSSIASSKPKINGIMNTSVNTPVAVNKNNVTTTDTFSSLNTTTTSSENLKDEKIEKIRDENLNPPEPKSDTKTDDPEPKPSGKSKLSDLLSASIKGDIPNNSTQTGSLRKIVGKKPIKSLYHLINKPVFSESNPSPFKFVNSTSFKIIKNCKFRGNVKLESWHEECISNESGNKNGKYRNSILEK